MLGSLGACLAVVWLRLFLSLWQFKLFKLSWVNPINKVSDYVSSAYILWRYPISGSDMQEKSLLMCLLDEMWRNLLMRLKSSQLHYLLAHNLSGIYQVGAKSRFNCHCEPHLEDARPVSLCCSTLSWVLALMTWMTAFAMAGCNDLPRMYLLQDGYFLLVCSQEFFICLFTAFGWSSSLTMFTTSCLSSAICSDIISTWTISRECSWSKHLQPTPHLGTMHVYQTQVVSGQISL